MSSCPRPPRRCCTMASTLGSSDAGSRNPVPTRQNAGCQNSPSVNRAPWQTPATGVGARPKTTAAPAQSAQPHSASPLALPSSGVECEGRRCPWPVQCKGCDARIARELRLSHTSNCATTQKASVLAAAHVRPTPRSAARLRPRSRPRQLHLVVVPLAHAYRPSQHPNRDARRRQDAVAFAVASDRQAVAVAIRF